MKSVLVGIHRLGSIPVRLYATDRVDGAEFETEPEDGGGPVIRIGCRGHTWTAIVGMLIHESFEMAAALRYARFTRTADVSLDSNGYYFFFDHLTYSEICVCAGEFVAKAQSPFAKAFKKLYGP